jgi:hypothetical protein
MFGSVVAQGQRGMKKTVASKKQGARSEETSEMRNAERPTLKSVRRCG